MSQCAVMGHQVFPGPAQTIDRCEWFLTEGQRTGLHSRYVHRVA
jgi:hypothetical protein